MKNLKLFCVTLICAVGLSPAFAQKPTKAEKKAAKIAEITRLINSGSYVFKADYVIPNGIPSRNLTSDYDVTVTPNKLEVWLPFFGRAYAPPRDPTDGGIKLTTANFTNKVVNKKNTWEITLTPKEQNPPGVKDVRYLQLSVGSDGYASLRVTSLNKEPISFNGHVEAIEVKKS
ncbi:DUF4251 domain-containing protein [Mucilaginibacter sp. dw_454]|uniref:DUF4251 domain-containing protein n=1 Tax=Mucilaginibacter sp. dw_454 TaxID=2720079 RepID=UPI001BD6D179|nr:DUF4251 domain-containing protein [Mucilaginibacter sp. dw_454]